MTNPTVPVAPAVPIGQVVPNALPLQVTVSRTLSAQEVMAVAGGPLVQNRAK